MRFLKRKLHLSQLHRQIQNESDLYIKQEEPDTVKTESSVRPYETELASYDIYLKKEASDSLKLENSVQTPDSRPLSSYETFLKKEAYDVVKTEYSVQTPCSELASYDVYVKREPSETIKIEDSLQNFISGPTNYEPKIEPEPQPAPVSDGKPRKMKSCEDTKNIAVNYGKAIITFAKSSLAIPYLYDYFTTNSDTSPITVADFISFLRQAKNDITGIEKFRNLLLVTPKDNARVEACKKAFQYISEVFIKYFSVNWIMHGKMAYKIVYLKYRSKMLRRVRNPEYFTYVRNVQRKQKSNKK